MLKSLVERVHESWVLVFGSGGVIFGAIFGLVFRVNYFFAADWIIFALLLFLVAFLNPRRAFMVLAFIAGMVLIFFRVASELYGENYVRQFYGEAVLISGTVFSDPETDETGTKLKLTNLEFGEEKVFARGNVYVLLKANREILRGDKIMVFGKLSKGFGTFSGYMYKPAVLEILRPEPGDLALRFRNFFSKRIISSIPEPEVSLGLSYLLGMRTGLPDELDENLRTVGLVHIVVASGAHLSILVEIARKIFGRVSRFFGLFTSTIFILFFMAMVGWTPSILRAGIMTILSLLAWYVGRKIAAWRLILVVAAFTLMLNPNFLFDLGWLLSFASFSGIMILGPILKRVFYGDKGPGFISSIIITTISATLMTLPITLYFYGTVSLISVFANLLVLPTLPYAMGLVFLTGVFAGMPIASEVVVFLASKLLDFHIFIVQMFAEMRSFLIEIPTGAAGVFLIYGLIFIAILYSVFKKWQRKKMW